MNTVRALWGSAHPGPSVVVTALAVALGVAAGLEPWRATLLGAAVLAGQLSVGISNDALDVVRDRAVGRTDKPLARGDITVRTAWIAAYVTLAAALVLSAPLGVGMLGAHAVFIGSAWAYNAGLKSTPVSIVPFLVGFGLFPSLATLSAADPSLAAPWAWAAGAALGAAVHLTNVLPDLDDDRLTGVRGLPHRLGPRVSAVLAASGIIAGALAVLLGPVAGDVSAVSAVSWVFFAGVVAIALATLLRVVLRPPDRTAFRLVMLAALLLAAQMVASGEALAG